MGHSVLLWLCVGSLVSTASSIRKETEGILDKAERAASEGKIELSAELFQEAIDLEPDEVGAFAYNGLGASLAQMGRAEDAIGPLVKAAELSTPDVAFQIYYNLARALQSANLFDEALNAYLKAAESNPKFAEAHIKAAWIYRQKGEFDNVLASLQEVIAIDPEKPLGYLYIGHTLNDLKRWDEALSYYQQTLDKDPRNAEALTSLGSTMMNLNKLEEALVYYRRAVKAERRDGDAAVGVVRAKWEMCLWQNDLEDRAHVINTIHMHHQHGMHSPLSPYDSLFLPLSAEFRAIIATTWSSKMIATYRAALRTDLFPDTKPVVATGRPLQIGYMSRRFESYAGTDLMLGVFSLHDRSKVTISAFATGPDDGSVQRRAIEEQADVFTDLSAYTPIEAARMIREQHIDVLVDYDGMHLFNNMEILSLRPAGTVITWLGFPGTTGTRGVVDYLMTDEVISPPEHRKFYSENLIYLPSTYQMQYVNQAISDEVITRQSENLPEDAFVFVCFNRNAKVDRMVFEAWMDILLMTPNSVLWLLKSHQKSIENMLSEAAARGVDAKRIVFAEKLPKDLHLARHRLADLFLDTLNYNAHTTATDALWAGLPVLTCIGGTFSSRVGASLLTAARLEPLITNSIREYVAKAIELASDRAQLKELSDAIPEHNNDRKGLFDTKEFVKGLETAFEKAHLEGVQGKRSEILRV